MNPTSERLAEVLAEFEIELPAAQVALLERYCGLLWEWNAKINLTRHTDYRKFVARDLVDSLALAKHLGPSEKILDVGSGGGVPGVVLAIVRTDLKVTLSESVGKKARALEDIVARLGLPIEVFHGRAEDLVARERFDTLTVRAVARLHKLLGWFKPHMERFDRLLIVKGPSWIDERGEARHLGSLKNLALRKLEVYTAPDTGAESVLLQIQRETPDRRKTPGQESASR